MDPITIAFLGTGALQLYGAFNQAKAIEESAKLTEQINEMNAEYAELDAYKTEKQGYSEVARYKSTINQTVSSQRAGYASDNVDVNYGTALELQQETKLVGMLNALDIQNAAHNKALGFKREAANIRLNGSMQHAQAELDAYSARLSGVTGAAKTGIAGYSYYKSANKKDQ